MALRFLCILFTIVSSATGALASDADILRRAIADAKDGATVIVAAGSYDIADLKIRRSVRLVGEGDVVFHSSRPVEKGLLNPLPGASLTIENVTLKGAQSPDRNGAGVRHDGDDLTIIDCRFVGNEDGVLYTGSPSGRIRIENTRFEDSGFGDGYSHAIYINEAASLEIDGSRFAGTKIGHHVKSLAKTTRVVNSSFDDRGAHTSYALDASAGGDVTFAGNHVIKSADADNPTIVNYDVTRGGEAASLRIENNRIENSHPNGRLLRNDTRLAPLISGNEIKNVGRGRLALGAPEARRER